MRSLSMVVIVFFGVIACGSTAFAQNVFHLSPRYVQSIVQKQEPTLRLSIKMPYGIDEQFVLERAPVVDAASRLTVMTQNGAKHTPLALTVATYRARLAGGGFAVFTFNRSGTMFGMIENGDGRFSISLSKLKAKPGEYIVQRDSVRPYSCATSESMSSDVRRLMDAVRAQRTDKEESTQANDTVDMRIAVEGDYLLLSNYPSTDAATGYITEMVALLSIIYESELSIRFVLGNVRLWETPDDPYPDELNIFDGLLERFILEYKTKMSSVDRDLAMFLTFRGGQGGIAASIGGVCSEDGSYCAGDVVNNIYGGLSSYSSDLFMMAHEIGHVCGGVHTQSCLWPGGPLDSCTISQEGTCVTWGMTKPTRGTLMSYCHQQLDVGATLVYEFHLMSRYMINAIVHSAPCLFNSPLPNTNQLHGIVTDASTGLPLAGLKLILGRYTDPVVTGLPTVDGDTVTTTAADGSYSFSGLGSGIYYLDSDGEWVPKLVGFGGLVLPNVVIVCEPSTEFNLSLARGHRIEVVLNTKDAGDVHNFNVYSEGIPELLSTAISPYDIVPRTDTTFSFIAYLPDGKYIVVPSSDSTTYVPNKFSFVLEESTTPQLPTVKATRSIAEPISSISLAFADQPATPTIERPHFIGGVPYSVVNTFTSNVVATGVIPDDGVIVVDSLPTNTQYNFVIDIDTSRKAPCAGERFVAPIWGMFATTYIQQDRRFPLIARAYKMSVSQTTYMPLTEYNVLLNSSTAILSPRRSVLPFELNILDRSLLDFYVSNYGYVSFGDVAPDPYSSNVLDFSTISPFVVTAFGDDLFGDDLSYPGWHVATQERGVYPNRTFVIEWKNLSLFEVDDSFNPFFMGPVSFQLLLHENGNIDMIYDTPGPLLEDTYVLVGLRGNDVYDNNMAYSAGGMSNATAGYYPDFLPYMTLRSPSEIPSGLMYHWELQATSVSDENDKETASAYYDASQSSLVINGVSKTTIATIVDLLGNTLLTTHLEPGTLTTSGQAWNLSSLASGRYTLLMSSSTSQDAYIVSKSFVIMR